MIYQQESLVLNAAPFMGSNPLAAARGRAEISLHVSDKGLCRCATGIWVPVLWGVQEPNHFDSVLEMATICPIERWIGYVLTPAR